MLTSSGRTRTILGMSALHTFHFIYRTCNWAGEFDGEEPKCDPKNCGIHPDIADAQVSPSGDVFFGMTVTVECDEGYILFGDSSR